jgi:hypothetical protein
MIDLKGNMMISYLRRKPVPMRNTHCCESPDRRWRTFINWLFDSLTPGVPVARLTAFETGAAALKSSVYVWRGIVFAAFVVGIMVSLFPTAAFAWSGHPSLNTPIYVAPPVPPNQISQSRSVCGAVADGGGGTYVVFTDTARSKSYIEHLDKDGNIIIIDSRQSSIKCNPSVGNGVVSDGSGSIIISSDRIVADNAGGSITILWNRGDKSISVQRSNAIGNLVWNQTILSSGTTLSSGTIYDIGFTSDGKGGIFVVWSEFHGKTSQYDIYAQHLKHDGTVQWGKWGNGVYGVAISTATNWQKKPIIMKDGTGGAIIAWMDDRNGATGSDIYAQRVDANGNSQWVPNGVPIVIKNGTQAEPVMTRTSDGVIITWWDQRRGNHNDIYAQKIDYLSGEVQVSVNK